MSRRNLYFLMAAIICTAICHARNEKNPQARFLSETFEAIEHEALFPVPQEELFGAAVKAMVERLKAHQDEHSHFFPGDQAEPLRAEMRQQFGGIGIRIHSPGDPPQLRVLGPPEPGTPAARAGLKGMDHIVKIDDQPTSKLDPMQVISLLRGAPGSTVNLKIERTEEGEEEPEELSFSLVREMIEIPSIIGDHRRQNGTWDYRLAEHPEIALIRIVSFGDKTREELAGVLQALAGEDVKGVILDLRDNTGGSFDAAVEVCDMLLPAGAKIVETRNRYGDRLQGIRASGSALYTNLKLVVLVNRETASASEIVAACLQDNHRAIVVGERSYGKGTVQHLIPLEAGRSELKLTTATYWRPSGTNIHRLPGVKEDAPWGVSPDRGYEVPLTKKETESWREERSQRDTLGVEVEPRQHDPVLARAVESLLSTESAAASPSPR